MKEIPKEWTELDKETFIDIIHQTEKSIKSAEFGYSEDMGILTIRWIGFNNKKTNIMHYMVMEKDEAHMFIDFSRYGGSYGA